jgi:BirA family biotin operon repressor/biotin-[acetyl-CoA-carboxylase] ligase
VLLAGRKIAGVLVDAAWQGEVLQSMVLGIGINVRQPAVPEADKLDFPAGSVEAALGRKVDREALLVDILASIGQWYRQLEDPTLVEAWERRLAYLGRLVEILEGPSRVSGRLEGLSSRGGLILKVESGERREIVVGQAHLRVIDRQVD